MTTELYIYCSLLGLLGMAFHIFALKAPGEKKRAEAANVSFSLGNYLKKDQLAIYATLIMLAIFVILLPDIVSDKPAILGKVKYAFVFVGYTGSSVLISLLGKFGNKVTDIVNIKTDIADGKD